MNRYGRGGWFKESHRHSLAARGITTNKYMANIAERAIQFRTQHLTAPSRISAEQRFSAQAKVARDKAVKPATEAEVKRRLGVLQQRVRGRQLWQRWVDTHAAELVDGLEDRQEELIRSIRHANEQNLKSEARSLTNELDALVSAMEKVKSQVEPKSGVDGYTAAEVTQLRHVSNNMSSFGGVYKTQEEVNKIIQSRSSEEVEEPDLSGVPFGMNTRTDMAGFVTVPPSKPEHPQPDDIIFEASPSSVKEQVERQVEKQVKYAKDAELSDSFKRAMAGGQVTMEPEPKSSDRLSKEEVDKQFEEIERARLLKIISKAKGADKDAVMRGDLSSLDLPEEVVSTPKVVPTGMNKPTRGPFDMRVNQQFVRAAPVAKLVRSTADDDGATSIKDFKEKSK